MRARIALVALCLTVAACGTEAPPTTGAVQQQQSSAGNELVVLEDDLKLQTVDNVVPVVSSAKADPVLAQSLNAVLADLDTEVLVGLNRQTDVERKTPADVARAHFAANGLHDTVPTGGSGKVVVGAANFSENQILAHLFVLALDKAGFTASVKPVTNREVYEPALERGDIHVMPEYVGTLAEFLNKKVNGPDAPAVASGELQTTMTALRSLAQKKGLTVLDPAEAADQNAFAVTKEFATGNNLTKLSDLRAYKGPIVLGGPPECPMRPFCQPGLEKTYGLTFAGFVPLDSGGPLTKTALKTGKVQLGLVFSSDGSLAQL